MWHLKIKKTAVGLERGPLSLVSTIEELLERISSDSGLENRDYGRGDYATPVYPQKLALPSATIGGSSVGIVRSRTKATTDRGTAACRINDCQLV
jgi:hypothetical protein